MSCAEFVQLIASEANTISEEEKKKTLNPEHVVKALDRLGFSSFTTDVSQFLEEVKENDKKCKPPLKCSICSLHAHINNMRAQERVTAGSVLELTGRNRGLACEDFRMIICGVHADIETKASLKSKRSEMSEEEQVDHQPAATIRHAVRKAVTFREASPCRLRLSVCGPVQIALQAKLFAQARGEMPADPE